MNRKLFWKFMLALSAVVFILNVGTEASIYSVIISSIVMAVALVESTDKK